MVDISHDGLMRPGAGLTERAGTPDFGGLGLEEGLSHRPAIQDSPDMTDPATQREIQNLQAMLQGAARQGTELPQDISTLSLAKEMKAATQKTGILQTLKSMFHYLTFNLFKRR